MVEYWNDVEEKKTDPPWVDQAQYSIIPTFHSPHERSYATQLE